MPFGLYISAEGAHAQNRRMEVIANNLANVDTTGFKRQLAVFQARYTESVARGYELPGSGGPDDLPGGVIVPMTKTELTPGPLKETGTPTDFAMRGEGFFLIQKGDETYLTRSGSFRLTEQGELVTEFGGERYYVLSDAGQKILLNPRDLGPWEVSPQGVVRQAGLVQNLAVVRPRSADDVVPVGENLFRVREEAEPVPLPERQIAQGYLEMSAVQPTNEMVALLETSRLLEANINMLQTQDQMLAGLFNRVLKTA